MFLSGNGFTELVNIYVRIFPQLVHKIKVNFWHKVMDFLGLIWKSGKISLIPRPEQLSLLQTLITLLFSVMFHCNAFHYFCLMIKHKSLWTAVMSVFPARRSAPWG